MPVSRKPIPNEERLIVAVDVPGYEEALALVDRLGDSVQFYKLGLELAMSDRYFDLVEELGGRVDLAPAGEAPVYLDVAEFFHQALETTRQVDFEVRSVRNRRRLGEDGWQRGEDGVLVTDDGHVWFPV